MYWNDPSLYGTTFANREFIPQQVPFYGQHTPFFQGYTHPWIMNQFRHLPLDRPLMSIDRRFAFPGYEYNMLPQFQNLYGNVPFYNYNTFRPFFF